MVSLWRWAEGVGTHLARLPSSLSLPGPSLVSWVALLSSWARQCCGVPTRWRPGALTRAWSLSQRPGLERTALTGC